MEENFYEKKRRHLQTAVTAVGTLRSVLHLLEEGELTTAVPDLDFAGDLAEERAQLAVLALRLADELSAVAALLPPEEV
jgi:hypothetical protein